MISVQTSYTKQNGEKYLRQSPRRTPDNLAFQPTGPPGPTGQWETAVKSTKTLLQRITNGEVLTYEELNTVLKQFEATLNSRPLSAMSADPSDFKTLTARYLLKMEPLVPLPSIPTTMDSSHSLTFTPGNRWALIQQT